jgi:chromosome partitioning protein
MIIAVINNKGGTGKTTTSVNLAGALAELGHRTLVIDLDPQASASISLGATPTTLVPSVSSVLFDGMRMKSAIRRSPNPKVDFVTSDMELIHSDVMLADLPGREGQLRDALKGVDEDYDFILCDCPPYFSMVSVNAMVAADAFVIPVTADYLTLSDLGRMLDVVEELRQNMSIEAELLGIILTMTPKRPPFLSSSVSRVWSSIRELHKHYGDDVFATHIDRDPKLASAPAYGNTIFGTAHSSRGAKQYLTLARELLDRCSALKLNGNGRRPSILGEAQQRHKRPDVFHNTRMDAQARRNTYFTCGEEEEHHEAGHYSFPTREYNSRKERLV